MVEIVGAEALAELAALEPIAEAVFGRGRRQPGWFARKLAREGVEARLSSVAATVPGEALGLERICGYLLLGRAPSRAAVARGSGVGVLASARGRGIGRALIEHALARAGAAGCDAVEFLAEPERVGWYLAQGFVVTHEQLTLLALGTGAPAAALRDHETPPARPARAEPLWSWVPEFWDKTPSAEQALVELGGARMWLTREGRAWLVHRCEPNDPAVAVRGLAALRRELAPTTPLLLYPCPADAPWLDRLREAGFAPAQRAFVVRRPSAGAGQSALGRRTSSA
ncbi:MAG: GNAT family N-acetyltransferase [Enhygromyxa sp.]